MSLIGIPGGPAFKISKEQVNAIKDEKQRKIVEQAQATFQPGKSIDLQSKEYQEAVKILENAGASSLLKFNKKTRLSGLRRGTKLTRRGVRRNPLGGIASAIEASRPEESPLG